MTRALNLPVATAAALEWITRNHRNPERLTRLQVTQNAMRAYDNSEVIYKAVPYRNRSAYQDAVAAAWLERFGAFGGDL